MIDVLETDASKKVLAKKYAINIKSTIFAHQADFLAILPIHDLVIFIKIYDNLVKIVDFID